MLTTHQSLFIHEESHFPFDQEIGYLEQLACFLEEQIHHPNFNRLIITIIVFFPPSAILGFL